MTSFILVLHLDTLQTNPVELEFPLNEPQIGGRVYLFSRSIFVIDLLIKKIKKNPKIYI